MKPTQRYLAIFIGILVCGSSLRAQDPQAEIQHKKAVLDREQKAREEYRLYFKEPKTAIAFWAAMKFEMETGKFDLAALHLERLLQLPADEADNDLLQLEDAEGMSAFLNLKNVRKWSDHPPFDKQAKEDVEKLLDRVTQAVEKHLGDPARLARLIQQLDASTIEERAYAFVQLKRARERTVPYLVEALQVSVGKSLHGRVVDAMLRLDAEIVPPLLEVFKAANPQDAQAADLRLTLLDIVKRRGDRRVVPYLWYLSSAPQYPRIVRERALETLAYLAEMPADRLPPAKMALVQMAERYYRHQVKFPAAGEVRIWIWDGQKLALKPLALSPPSAEEFFGKRYAREALELDPTYQPAQIVLLSLILERELGPKLDKMLLEPTPPAVQKLLATIDAELIVTVLEQALNEYNLPVALATIQALGERGDVHAARVSASGPPRGLLRALYYPDRRVQLASVRALVRMPTTPAPVGAIRVVDVLRRFLAADAVPRVLVAFVPDEQAAEVRKNVKAAGFEPVLAKTLKEAFEILHRATDFEAVILHQSVPEKELPYILTQLRGDADVGALPVMVLAGKDNQEQRMRMAARHRQVWVMPETLALLPDELKNVLEARIRGALGMPLSPEERNAYARLALGYLWKMTRGELPGYDVRPAGDAVVTALRNPDLAVEALEILGRLPGLDTQQKLAAVVLDPAGGKLRIGAAIELNRHLQKNGVLLSKFQLDGIKTAFKNPAEEPALREQLALVMGSVGTSSLQTGIRLYQFQPDPPQAPPKKEEKQ